VDDRTLIFSSHAIKRMFSRRISETDVATAITHNHRIISRRHPFPSYLTLEQDNCIIILKDIPADICENCEEYYLSQSTTAVVLSRAEHQSEVEILRFAA
jgi:Domain of unknown function (DUF4258)